MPYKNRKDLYAAQKRFREKRKTAATVEAEAYVQVLLAEYKRDMAKAEKEKRDKAYVEQELRDFFDPIFKLLSMTQKDRIFAAMQREIDEKGDSAMHLSQAKKYLLEQIKQEVRNPQTECLKGS